MIHRRFENSLAIRGTDQQTKHVPQAVSIETQREHPSRIDLVDAAECRVEDLFPKLALTKLAATTAAAIVDQTLVPNVAQFTDGAATALGISFPLANLALSSSSSF